MARTAKAAKATSEQDDYLRDLKRKFMRAQDVCEPARKDAETDQDYFDGKQWTPSEVSTLNRRKQPALVFNHVKPAVNAVIGIVDRGRTDPKAWGRTPQDGDSAEVATDALRYAADINRLQSVRSGALRDLLIPGICCAVVEVDENRDPKVTKGRPEEFFYDPYSREPDFSDARYLGLAKWMDEDDALALVPTDDPKAEEKRDAITASINANGMLANDSHMDRPKGWSWADAKTRRVMVVEMYHRNGAVWNKCRFVAGAVLESGPSPYRDDKGKPFCNLIAQSAYVDLDNARYGIVRDMRGPQDAINKGRSKAIHLLNVSKLRISKRVGDVDEVRAEYAKPDGIIQGDQGDVEELGDKQLMPAHIELLRDAKDEMRRQSPTPGIVGRQSASQSGRAILAEQQAGMAEQAPLLASFDDWSLRIYRAMWCCIKQFWTEQKYVRVTDDENAPKYILLNGPQMDPQTGQPQVNPQTGQPVMHIPAMMDMDIVIDSSPDVAVLQQEQYKDLIELATIAMQTGQPNAIPFDAIIEASSLPRKKQILDKMKNPQQPSQDQLEAQQIAKEGAMAKVAVDKTRALKTIAETHKIDAEIGAAQTDPMMQMQSQQNDAAMAQDAHAQQMQQADQAHQMKMGQMDQAHRAKMAQALQAMQLKAQQGGEGDLS